MEDEAIVIKGQIMAFSPLHSELMAYLLASAKRVSIQKEEEYGYIPAAVGLKYILSHHSSLCVSDGDFRVLSWRQKSDKCNVI